MKLLTFKNEGRERLGVLSKDENFIITLKNYGITYKTMNELIEHITSAEMQLICMVIEKERYGIPVNAVEKMPPIPFPKQDIICLGINFMEHAEESARYKEEAFGGERPYAVYFSKRVNSAVADGGIIHSYQNLVDSLDYEAELAVIIRKDAFNVSKEDAYNYVFGYTIINDISARNLQTRHKQWYFGKSLDTFLPMGPCIVTVDELKNPLNLKIQSRVNGEIRQDSSTSLLIFDIAHVISELSQGMTLKSGTIISMGTPAGVGMGFEPPRFLKPGDIVECEIEGIGCLKNFIK